MEIKDFMKRTAKLTSYGGYGGLEIRPQIECNDGFKMSVQASRSHYCEPRQNLIDGEYTEVEIGFPSEEEPLINEYAECPGEWTGTVYGYVPVTIVDEIINKHGGIKL
jgi:hypothetical protein